MLASARRGLQILSPRLIRGPRDLRSLGPLHFVGASECAASLALALVRDLWSHTSQDVEPCSRPLAAACKSCRPDSFAVRETFGLSDRFIFAVARGHLRMVLIESIES